VVHMHECWDQTAHELNNLVAHIHCSHCNTKTTTRPRKQLRYMASVLCSNGEGFLVVLANDWVTRATQVCKARIILRFLLEGKRIPVALDR